MKSRCFTYWLWLSFTALIAIYTKSYAQDGQYVLTRYMDAVSNGDPKKWDKISSAYIESTSSYNSALADGGIPGFIDSKPGFCRIYRIWPDLYRLDLWKDSVLVSSAYGIGKKSFVVMDGGSPITLGDSPYDSKFEFMPVTITRAAQKSKVCSVEGYCSPRRNKML
jgi:hypothetical protein